MSAVRRLAGHSCRTFLTLADVLRALATRQDPRGYVSMFATSRTSKVYRALENSRATHRCAECKRWVSVTPSHFRPSATAASLTRLTAEERRQLYARPIVFTVSPRVDASDAPALARLPAYGFDVRHPQTQELRGRDSVAWKGARKLRHHAQ